MQVWKVGISTWKLQREKCGYTVSPPIAVIGALEQSSLYPPGPSFVTSRRFDGRDQWPQYPSLALSNWQLNRLCCGDSIFLSLSVASGLGRKLWVCHDQCHRVSVCSRARR